MPGCCPSGKIQFGTTDILSPKINTTSLRRRIGTIFQKPPVDQEPLDLSYPDSTPFIIVKLDWDP